MNETLEIMFGIFVGFVIILLVMLALQALYVHFIIGPPCSVCLHMEGLT